MMRKRKGAEEHIFTRDSVISFDPLERIRKRVANLSDFGYVIYVCVVLGVVAIISKLSLTAVRMGLVECIGITRSELMH